MALRWANVPDKKIKIWSTVPILDPDAEIDEANPRLLCTMSQHTGQLVAPTQAKLKLSDRFRAQCEVGAPRAILS